MGPRGLRSGRAGWVPWPERPEPVTWDTSRLINLLFTRGQQPGNCLLSVSFRQARASPVQWSTAVHHRKLPTHCEDCARELQG